MQRAMNDSYDYTKDYAMGFGDVESVASTEVSVIDLARMLISIWWYPRARDAEDAQRIRLVCDFYNDRWTANRSVTAVDWSTKVSL